MKIKKVILGLSILAASLLFFNCKKKEPNVEPVADTETQTAIDAAWATYVVTDIDQICAFVLEDVAYQHFYVEAPGQGTFTAVRDLSAKQFVAGWNRTTCLDGRLRDGSIFMYYKKDPLSNPDANENSRYYRDFGFVGRIQLSNYKVDGWLIELLDPAAPAYVYNKLTTDAYDPKVTRLTWMIKGRFKMSHPTDPAKNITWEGELLKTLTNSNDPLIFNPSKQQSINWVRPDPKAPVGAMVTYSGKAEGFTDANKKYSMVIDEKTPLLRDFLCTSDPVADVNAVTQGTVTTISTQKEEHHPFKAGIASFTTTNAAGEKLYPRQIYFGNEGNEDLPTQCDNTGVVLIKGISYRVNFRK